MIKKKSVYRCALCGNIVESLWNGRPDIHCCGKVMEEVTLNTQEASKEKHIPVISRNGDTVTVKVGSVAHPMEPKHYILFVEVLAGDKVYRQDFAEGTAVAEATFTIKEQNLSARAFCNTHGFWSTN